MIEGSDNGARPMYGPLRPFPYRNDIPVRKVAVPLKVFSVGQAKNLMVITTRNGETFDTERDLTAPERHILQKLFLWEPLFSSLQDFREKKEEALHKGWNQSGPIKEGRVLSLVIEDLESRITSRLGDG